MDVIIKHLLIYIPKEVRREFIHYFVRFVCHLY